MLLYRKERPQYAQLRHPGQNLKDSEMFGADHFVRLFVQLPTYLSKFQEDARLAASDKRMLELGQQLNYIMAFLETNEERYFPVDRFKNNGPEVAVGAAPMAMN